MVARSLLSKAKDKKVITDMPGHTKMKAWELIRPGDKGSLHTVIILDEFEPGGGIELHYHDLVPVCDHAYYVISGQIQATLGDREEVVGPDTLIYCLTDELHALRNVGKGKAKLLRIGAAATGEASGKSVWVKEKKKRGKTPAKRK